MRALGIFTVDPIPPQQLVAILARFGALERDQYGWEVSVAPPARSIFVEYAQDRDDWEGLPPEMIAGAAKLLRRGLFKPTLRGRLIVMFGTGRAEQPELEFNTTWYLAHAVAQAQGGSVLDNHARGQWRF